MFERISELAEKKGISKRRLALELGFSPSSFTDWTSGKVSPTAKSIVAIADYFGVSVDYLLERDEYAPPVREDERELLSIYRSLKTSGKVRIMVEAYNQKKRAAEENV